MSEPQQQTEPWALLVEVECTPMLVEGGDQHVIALEQPETVIVAAGVQGPPGPKGPPGGGVVEWQACDW